MNTIKLQIEIPAIECDGDIIQDALMYELLRMRFAVSILEPADDPNSLENFGNGKIYEAISIGSLAAQLGLSSIMAELTLNRIAAGGLINLARAASKPKPGEVLIAITVFPWAEYLLGKLRKETQDEEA